MIYGTSESHTFSLPNNLSLYTQWWCCSYLTMCYKECFKRTQIKQVLCNISSSLKLYKRCQFSQTWFSFHFIYWTTKMIFSFLHRKREREPGFVTSHTQENYYLANACGEYGICIILQEHQLQCQNHSSTHEIVGKCVQSSIF